MIKVNLLNDVGGVGSVGAWMEGVKFWRGWRGWRGWHGSIKFSCGLKSGVGGAGQNFDVGGVDP